jgi:hypothetical protein
MFLVKSVIVVFLMYVALKIAVAGTILFLAFS